MKKIYSPTPNAERIVGLAGTGKTKELIDRIQALLEAQVPAQDIVVFCATPDACVTFAQRVEGIHQNASDLKITTPRAYALDILSEKDAVAFTGRQPRLLTDFEINFLLEDMKTCGIRPRRLREILKFIYRGWTELEDEVEGWLITSEEESVHDLVKKYLALYERILEPELANLALRFLRHDAAHLEKHTVAHVFVDDYQCLSRASQVIVNILATESITVAGHTAECVEVFESYPYENGLDEFLTINEHAHDTQLNTCYLPSEIYQATNKILADETIQYTDQASLADGVSEGSCTTLSSETYTEEFDTVAQTVADHIAAGMKPSDIFVISPHKAWTNKLSAALEDRGISQSILSEKQPLNGDLRDFKKSMTLRIYTALRLVADPSDATAWRAWCGFGDYLANSAVFVDIRNLADEHACSLPEMLKKLDAEEAEVSGAEKVLAAYRAACSLLAKVEEMTGEHLLVSLSTYISNESNPAFRTVFNLCEIEPDGTEGAQEMMQNVSLNLHFPHFAQDESCVKIGSLIHLCGLHPQLIVYSGFMNGFFPDRDYLDTTITHLEKQQKLRTKNLRTLYTALSKSTDGIILSYFEKTDLESAEMLKLEIERIRLENNVRTCTLSPSIYLDLLR